jgi:deoxycytidylate deaminase
VGYNSPAHEDESQMRCFVDKNTLHRKVTDKTCCVHAEQRAIMDALRNNPDGLIGSTLYFIRLGLKGEMSFSGEPYCTICSKMALDTGIKEFVLCHKD